MNVALLSAEREVSKATLRQAVKQNSGLKKRGVLEQLFAYWFNGLVYNQIWEDPVVDAEALELCSGKRIMTIASGGCNALNYLVYDPARVEVVDLNPYHMHLTRLKLTALKALPTYEDFFSFFAAANTEKNIENYHRYIAPVLLEATRAYWEGGSWYRRYVLGPRVNYFKKGFYNYGRSGYFIRFIHFVSNSIGLKLGKVLDAKTLDEQRTLYQRYIEPGFNHWVVRTLAKMPVTVYSLGIPPQQFDALCGDKYSQQDQGLKGIISVFRERTRRLACDFPVGENYFAWQSFARKYDLSSQKALPLYLQREHYETIKSRVDRIATQVMTITEFLKSQADNALDGFVLLDSQDWMTDEQLNELWTELSRVGNMDARVVYRTAASDDPVHERLDTQLQQEFQYQDEQSHEFYNRDRSAVYGGFHLHTRRAT